MSNPYVTACEIQNACNLTGVVHEFSRTVKLVREEADKLGKGTDYINTHPVVVAFVDKLVSLSGHSFSNALKAHGVCQDKADEAKKAEATEATKAP